MRPGHDEWGLRLAEVYAQRATCLRRSVGCVLMNARHQDIGAGYNGRAAGQEHCNQPGGRITPVDAMDVRYHYPHACSGATSPSGTNLDGCEAIHAEQNALLKCRDVYAIDTCYVTVSPCVTCVKLLMNTSCRRIVFRERYAHEEPARKLWEESMYTEVNGTKWRRTWTCLPRS